MKVDPRFTKLHVLTATLVLTFGCKIEHMSSLEGDLFLRGSCEVKLSPGNDMVILSTSPIGGWKRITHLEDKLHPDMIWCPVNSSYLLICSTHRTTIVNQIVSYSGHYKHYRCLRHTCFLCPLSRPQKPPDQVRSSKDHSEEQKDRPGLHRVAPRFTPCSAWWEGNGCCGLTVGP